MSPSLQSMPRQTTPLSSAALPSATLQFPANEPQSYRRIDSLFASQTLAVTDVTCTCPRSPAGALRESGAYQLIFVRRGVFVKHGTARSWPEVAAEPAHVLLLNSGEPYRVSHLSSRGDACTAVAYESRMVAEVAKASGAPEKLAARNPFPAGSAVVPPAAILRLHWLRQWLRTPDAIVTPGEVEMEALGLLRMVLASAWRRYRSAEPAADDEADDELSSDVLPGRPDIVETVKQALARCPAAATSLDDLATYIGMSPLHLARVFSRGAGLPVHQYLLRLRLGTALERMSDTSVRMSAIALDAGFFERESLHECVSQDLRADADPVASLVASAAPDGLAPRPTLRSGADKAGERDALTMVGTEVRGFEPGLQGGADARPVAIDDGVPGGVAIAAFDDDRLPKRALIGETEAFGGAAGGRVEGVALPFDAALAQ